MYEELIRKLRYEAPWQEEDIKRVMLDATNAIEHLLNELAETSHEMQKQMCRADGGRWIPVNDRLPEFDKVVLVTDGKDVDTGWANEWIARDGERKVAWASPFADFDDVDSITHWMPLPTPPKEETE